MYNDELTAEGIKSEMERLQEKLTKLSDLMVKIASIKFYECGIRKSDHRICHFNFSLVGTDAVIRVQVVSHNESYNTSLDSFINDYVPYSEKTRSILPKRSKR